MADETSEDEQTTGGTPPAESTSEQSRSTRRPTAAASAASRARRIGGARTVTAPAGDGSAPSAPGDDDAGTGTPVSTDKPAREPRPAARAAHATEDTHASDATTAPAVGGSSRDRPVVEVPAWLRWAPAGVLSVCAIVMIVLILVTAHGVWYSKPSSSATRDRVLAAAKTCTAAANTYSYQTLKQDEAKGLACSTGAWSREYRKAIKSIVTPAATRLKASQSIQINNAGIETISENGRQWTVVVFGQTKITQSGKKARLDPFSAQVVMSDVDGTWLISKIKTIVNPSG